MEGIQSSHGEERKQLEEVFLPFISNHIQSQVSTSEPPGDEQVSGFKGKSTEVPETL